MPKFIKDAIVIGFGRILRYLLLLSGLILFLLLPYLRMSINLFNSISSMSMSYQTLYNLNYDKLYYSIIRIKINIIIKVNHILTIYFMIPGKF